MLAIDLWMTAGRYHATPWDHHVNEGITEWPPSPWRICRALLAAWHRKAADIVSAEMVRALVDRMSASLPSYHLPPVTASHTRHFMPLYKDTTTKVFDAFLHLDANQPIQIQWPDIELGEAERMALVVLLDRLAYLGRAESWVEATLAETLLPVNAAPVERQPEGEVVRVLCPVPRAEYVEWRGAMLDGLAARALEDERRKNPDKEPRLTAAGRRRIEAAVPPDLFAALHAETSDLRKRGWSRPPGSRWVDYTRPGDLITVGPTRRKRRASLRPPTIARYAVASAVPPKLTDAVSLADRVRQTLIKWSDGAPVFTGRGRDGERLVGHEHAYFLSECSRGDGRISHLTIAASMGFDDTARQAIERATRVWGHEGHDVELILLGVGDGAEFGGLAAGACRLLVPARRWRSRTPFVPTRHPKYRRGGEPKLDERGHIIGGPEHDLARLLEAEGLPAPVALTRTEHTRLRGKQTRWLRFRLHRSSGGGRRGTARGYGFEIDFGEPVTGPIALGYNAHFGLGLFEPVLSDDPGSRAGVRRR